MVGLRGFGFFIAPLTRLTTRKLLGAILLAMLFDGVKENELAMARAGKENPRQPGP